MSAQILTLPSFAKINLSLRVLGRRADGYHEIQTVFQTVSLHDRLTFTVLPDGQFALACDVAGIPVDEMNLIWRAAAALRE
ncbi:MAG: 4-(cytidine 5'-diphospho)-2-C-methyl-D-erythritol kinase, partial [Acidobacteriota bacterium]|nr:4-(cytidine 5'-diphospho)-2-C-methyl-D-erythritol kinase [Acidobacteriota bacterium]